MPVEILEDRWPLVVIRWPAETTKEDVARYIERSLDHLRRREPHVVLHDAMRGVHLAPTERKRFADHLAEHDVSIRAFSVAVAIASPSPLLRGLITAVNWITPTPCPQRAFATPTAAEEWLDVEYQKRMGRRLALGRRAASTP